MKRLIIEYIILTILVGGTVYIGTYKTRENISDIKIESSESHSQLNTNLKQSNIIGIKRNEILSGISSDLKKILEQPNQCKNGLANIEKSIKTIADQLYIDLNN